MSKTIASCPTCGYPILFHSAGEITACANCSQQMESISGTISGMTVPWALVTFALGMLVGPILMASSGRGRSYLEKRARGG